MPGICGIVRNQPDSLASKRDAMIQSMRWHDWYQTAAWESGPTGRAALGRVSRGPAAVVRQDQRAIVFDGELYDRQAVAAQLGVEATAVDANNDASLLLLGFSSHGAEFLRRLNGSFVAAIWDGDSQQLTLLNDHFGTRPLYYTAYAGQVRFANGLQAVLADEGVSREPNWQGIAQFFTFGHYLQNDTSLRDVAVLPAASIATFDATTGAFDVAPYWKLADVPGELPGGREQVLEQIDSAFAKAVRRTTADAPGLGLALSGGLDARSILGLVDPEQTPLQSVCLGMRGSLDHRSAQRMADVVGCKHHNHILTDTFLANFEQYLRGMVELTDGQYLSQCIVMPTLSLYRELGIKTLLRGHAGELMHMRKAYAYSLDEQALSIRREADLRHWLHRQLQAYMLAEVEQPLFVAGRQEEITELASQSLDACIEEAACDGPVLNRVWRLFVGQRLRRETTLSLVKFRSVVETRLPYLDTELVELLLAAPPNVKLDETLQAFILARHSPALLDVVNTNTGARVGAGTLTQQLATLKMRVFGKLGLPGYQPYERLGLWLRRELAPLVQNVLLDSQCLERGIFDSDGLRAVVSAHLEGRRNHTFLLMALMIFELGQRRFVQPDECLADASGFEQR